MFDTLIKKIVSHPSYGPAVQSAISEGLPLALNYHTHGPDSDYCVSICAVEESTIKLLDKPQLAELAHIRGFGKSEEECIPLTTKFADSIRNRLRFTRNVEVYLNGEPLAT